jgi:hypothetical protein
VQHVSDGASGLDLWPADHRTTVEALVQSRDLQFCPCPWDSMLRTVIACSCHDCWLDGRSTSVPSTPDELRIVYEHVDLLAYVAANERLFFSSLALRLCFVAASRAVGCALWHELHRPRAH